MSKFKSKALVLLSVIMLLAIFAVSCGGNNQENPQGNSSEDSTDAPESLIEYPITEYTVIRPEKASDTLLKSIASLRKQINTLLVDTTIPIQDDWVKGGVITDEIISAKEILIGNTTRPQSMQALEGIDPTSYVIKVIDNKIVINAENPTMLFTAIDYFKSNCINIVDNKLLLAEDYCFISAPVSQVGFIENNSSSASIVYLDSLDNTFSATNENDRLDLDVVYAKNIRDSIQKSSGVKLSLATDWVKPGTDVSDKLEILVGNTSRNETAEFLSTLAYNEYGFGVYGNKIVVTGWNETTTELAVNEFLSYFNTTAKKNSDGTYNFSMLSTEKMVFDSDKWFDGYPKFDFGKHGGTQDAGYGNLQAYHTDTTIDDYNKYCELLVNSGFQLYMENNMNDNIHRAYTSNDGMLYVYYVPVEKSVRIISCRDGEYNLPQYITPESVPAYEKIAEPAITQCELSYEAGNFGLCHIITLDDGSFIVYDGGGNSNGDYVRLYETLKKLNKRSDGKIVIAAWILTHEHWDHYTNFSTFCKNYSNKIKLEGMYCNTPSGSFAYNGYNPNYYMTQDFANLSATLGGVKKYILHTGMKFYIRNACVEVLYTQEDLYPTKLYYFNDCTLVTSITIAGQKITYLGDVRYEGSDIMCDRYGKLLASDIVQVSHHGYDGGTTALYKLLNPETCLWPSPIKDYEKFSDGSTSGYMSVNTFIFHTLKVKTNIFAEPTSTIMLPFKTGDRITYWN